MKLQTQFSIIQSSFTLIAFTLIGIALYYLLQQLGNDELDAILRQERTEVLSNPELLIIANQAGAPFFSRLIATEVEKIPDTGELYYDSISRLPGETTESKIRCLKFFETVQGQPVQFILFKSKLPALQLVRRLSVSMSILAVLFLIGMFLVDRLVFKRVWRDFFMTIARLKDYSPGQEALALPGSTVDEFDVLNREVEKMTRRTSETYDSLNRFTSHTTHEIQTPLAVIRSKSELLMQTENLSEEQLKLIESIGDNSRHLSQITRTLSLLFKIDNQHYDSGGSFAPADAIIRQLDNLEGLTEMKNLKVETRLDHSLIMPMDPSLGEHLVHNLLKNAVVHNLQGGWIEIEMAPGMLRIANSGHKLDHPTGHYFSEFVKGADSKGLGLGLSLIRRICEVSGLTVQFESADSRHEFQIAWAEKK